MAQDDHKRIHGRDDAVEYYTPLYIMDAVRGVLGGIDYDPASNALANELVQATNYSTDPGYVDFIQPIDKSLIGRIGALPTIVNPLPYRFFHDGGLSDWWHGRVWLNHPFGRDEKACKAGYLCTKKGCIKRGYHLASDKAGSYRWISRLVRAYEFGSSPGNLVHRGVTAAATITFANTDANWFRLLLPYPQVYLYNRVNFMIPDNNGGLKKSNGVSKGAVITFFGCDVDTIYQQFKAIGELKLSYKGSK